LLAKNEIHTHFLKVSGEAAPGSAEGFSRRLPPEERGQYHRLGSEGRRWEFLWSRLFLRQVLSGYLGNDIWNLEFGDQDRGKPFLDGSGLQFNLSHTDGVIACSVGRHALGVDIEKIDVQARKSWTLIAERCFSPAEREYLGSRPDGSQAEAFFRMFTMKEAYVKALGCGLGLSLAGFTLPLPITELSQLKRFEIFTSVFERDYSFALAVENPTNDTLRRVFEVWDQNELVNLLNGADFPGHRPGKRDLIFN
jgi:4'-phosphopantetheinyl transferase